MTQQLADRIELTRQTVIAIEGDKYSPSLERAFRIANVFGVGLEEVFQYEEVKKKGKRYWPHISESRCGAPDVSAGDRKQILRVHLSR